jgi:proteasome accessory factor C
VSGSRKTSRSRSDVRLRRLLVMVPWLASQDGPSVAEVCERFGITPPELQADLELLTLYVGIHPYGPEAYFDLSIEGDRVYASMLPSLDRPLRLTPAEAVAVVVAGQAAAAAGELDDTLSGALAKLAKVLGIEPAEAVDVQLGSVDSSILDLLRTGAAQHRRVRIRHYAEGRDAAAWRTVDPWTIASSGGSWYLWGHDHDRDDTRSFRVDRILEAELLDEAATPAPDGTELDLSMGQDAPLVTLELDPGGAWVAEAYPVEEAEVLDDGRLRVTLRVGGRAWLERLLLRLGPAARVVDGPDDLLGAGREAADRVLERYRR